MASSRSDRGAVAVEFALVIPPFLMLLLGICEFGYAFFLQGSAAGAAREGARALALESDTSAGRTAAIASFRSTTDRTPSSVTATGCCPCSNSKSALVTVTYRYSGLTGFFGNQSVTGKGEMRCGG